MASISKLASYVEFKVERPSDIDRGSSDEEENVVTTTNTLAKKPKHRWTCGLRRSSTSSSTAPTPPIPTKVVFKVSFTVQGVHSFCLRIEPNSDIETHNILHGSDTQRSVTLQEPTQSWRTQITSALSGTIPDQLMGPMASKLQRDLASLPLPGENKWYGRVARSRLVVFHVHVPVKVVTPDGVTADTLLNRVSAPVSRRRVEGDDEDCVICLEGLEVERGSLGLQVRRMLVCSHVFHGECLLRWLLKRASCPVCWSKCLGLFFPVE